MIVSVTRMRADDIQANPFRVPTEVDDKNTGND